MSCPFALVRQGKKLDRCRYVPIIPATLHNVFPAPLIQLLQRFLAKGASLVLQDPADWPEIVVDYTDFSSRPSASLRILSTTVFTLVLFLRAFSLNASKMESSMSRNVMVVISSSLDLLIAIVGQAMRILV